MPPRRSRPALPSSRSATFLPTSASGPLMTVVTATGFSWRSALPHRREELRIEPLDEDVERAPARQPDAPGRVVGDAVVEELRLPARERFLPGFDHRVFHTAARDRAGDPPVGPQRHLAPGRPGRRAPRLDVGGSGDGPGLGLPMLDFAKEVSDGGIMRREARLCARPLGGARAREASDGRRRRAPAASTNRPRRRERPRIGRPCDRAWLARGGFLASKRRNCC